jgi:acyl-CoA reductase-like NAD-dependent aldehyde dehydrogenase
MLLGSGKLFPALLAGNTFIWKPSPYSPYSALKLAEIGAKVFPPGVFQALSGEENLGPMLTAHPGVNKVSFTGSVGTGKKVMAACASTVKRVTLELGGNDAAIVCDDVDIEKVVSKVLNDNSPKPRNVLITGLTGGFLGIRTYWSDLHEREANLRS